MYTLDELPTPFAKRLNGTDLTLKDFIERVFARKGEYRYVLGTIWNVLIKALGSFSSLVRSGNGICSPVLFTRHCFDGSVT